eukprot:8156890-Lingulodinium_polyedra.AAC.1
MAAPHTATAWGPAAEAVGKARRRGRPRPDPELEARTAAARRAIRAQLGAARAGLGTVPARSVLPGEDVALRNVAVHNFERP